VSELHKFLFEGLPVRGMIVRLTDAWTEILKRRAQSAGGAYPAPVRALLGEMLAAATLMQSNIKFNGALVLQIFGDGPLKLAVAEAQSDFRLRATAHVHAPVPAQATLEDLVNVHGLGRCAVTLDPQDRLPGQQPYQGVVPLTDADGRRAPSMAEALQLYMRQSEQLDTTLVLAADDRVAAGLLIQRLPVEGMANLAGQDAEQTERVQARQHEDYQRIALLAASLKREELLTLEVDSILHRLFWQERLQRFEPLMGAQGPRFACTCSRERVAAMIRGLGEHEARAILAERGVIGVDCDFCGTQYRFDAIDVSQIFTQTPDQPPSSACVQ
jgi:molecular chaperone Hsp33